MLFVRKSCKVELELDTLWGGGHVNSSFLFPTSSPVFSNHIKITKTNLLKHARLHQGALLFLILIFWFYYFFFIIILLY